MRFELSTSLMCMDLLNVQKQLAILEDVVDWHHVDIMDGHYCPNLCLSPDFVRAVCGVTKRPVEVHLMITEPAQWIPVFAQAGAAMISLHSEAINVNAFRLIRMVRDAGCKVGAVLNPATPLSYCQTYLDEVDCLTLMTVDVGYAGQPLVPQVLDKLREAAAYKKQHGLRYTIQIDGCCNAETYRRYAEAGAERLVMGSGLFGLDPDLSKAIPKMQEQQAKALKEAACGR